MTQKGLTQSDAQTRRAPATKRTAVRSAARVGPKSTTKSGAPRYTEDQIRERAYYIYMARGGEAGDPLEDWLQAERELGAAPSYTQA